MNKYFFLNILLILIIVSACHKEDEATYIPTPYTITIPKFFPTNLNLSEDNPLTVEGIELGRYLFYDGRLSGYLGSCQDSLMSCATCHVQENAFESGVNNPRFPNGQTKGRTGLITPHYMLPLFNIVFNKEGYFWNGMICPANTNLQQRTLEDIVRMGVVAEHEMASTEARAVAAVSSIAIYPPMFKKAFGTEDITFDKIQKAIGQFIRTIISSNSKFDKYMRNEVQLTSQELNGYILFTTEEGADCFHCHGGSGNVLFTTNLFYNNGTSSTFDDKRDRYAFTGNINDKGAYKAPTLRNIALTAPYMHDGRFKSLDEVLEFYNEGLVNTPYVSVLMHKLDQGGMALTPSQLSDLKAFLETLTDSTLMTNSKYAKPKDLP